MTVLLSCEHATNFVPDEFIPLFSRAAHVLNSHQGWDPGALSIAQVLKKQLQVPLFKTEVTRLLVEVNRSMDHPQLFSIFTDTLPASFRETLLDRFYFPYRNAIFNFVKDAGGPVFHVSIHTFTPTWNGKIRAVDVGILFDPSRELEQTISSQLHDLLHKQLPSWMIRDNEPYKGIDDGLTTYLRTQFPDQHYAGIEIEINQKFSDKEREEAALALSVAIKKIIGGASG